MKMKFGPSIAMLTALFLMFFGVVNSAEAGPCPTADCGVLLDIEIPDQTTPEKVDAVVQELFNVNDYPPDWKFNRSFKVSLNGTQVPMTFKLFKSPYEQDGGARVLTIAVGNEPDDWPPLFVDQCYLFVADAGLTGKVTFATFSGFCKDGLEGLNQYFGLLNGSQAFYNEVLKAIQIE